MNNWKSNPSVIYSLYYFLTIIQKQEFFSWFYRSIAYTHKQVTRRSNLGKATVFVDIEDIASLLESWKSGKTLLSQQILEGTELHTFPCSIVSQRNEIVDNYLPINQFGVCGKNLKQ